MCDPATKEVRQVNAQDPTYYMAENTDIQSYFMKKDLKEAVLDLAINMCKLQRRYVGGCTGFAIDEGKEWFEITLLYKKSKETVKYSPAKTSKVYSIAACL